MVDESKILSAYKPYETTLREVARMCGTDHHTVKRVLGRNGVVIVKGRRGPFTEDHRRKISEATKGRAGVNKGKKASRTQLIANMAAHIRFDVSQNWLNNFDDVEKLKLLNSCVTRRGDRFNVNTLWYMEYIEKFYSDYQFNMLYQNWLESGCCKWKRPTVDHIISRAKGGGNEVENLQFLTWLENRAKCDMSQEEWLEVKLNLKDYLS